MRESIGARTLRPDAAPGCARLPLQPGARGAGTGARKASLHSSPRRRFWTASSGGRPAPNRRPSRLRPRSVSRRLRVRVRASTTAEPASRRASPRRREPAPGRQAWLRQSPTPSFSTGPRRSWPRRATAPASTTLQSCPFILLQSGTCRRRAPLGVAGRRCGRTAPPGRPWFPVLVPLRRATSHARRGRDTATSGRPVGKA